MEVLMPEQKKRRSSEKEFLAVIPDAMPTLDDQQSIPLRETAFLTLRKLILTGKLHPGERLTEVRLGKILGTSRTPIREAIRKLELEGLVAITPGSGARVARITEEDLQDVMEVRSALDQLCASLASQRITEEEKKELIRSRDAFEASTRFGDQQEIAENDVHFHDVIAAAARNRRLDQVMTGLADTIYRFRYEYIRDDLHYEELIEEHRVICQAVLEGDSETASRAARDHIDRQRDYILSQIRKMQQ
ncbi:MAG: GntR family transcriptional regulator [Sarcina sp.]|nr:GntR family transcriptional regulator [Sarcina sp.]HAL59232.1 GntR family transcriptional regulator [Sarcina sp.]